MEKVADGGDRQPFNAEGVDGGDKVRGGCRASRVVPTRRVSARSERGEGEASLEGKDLPSAGFGSEGVPWKKGLAGE